MKLLKNRWDSLAYKYWTTYKADEIWKIIENAYSNPQRYYHNFKHIEAIFLFLDSYLDELEDKDVVAFSVWFHDIVYDFKAKDNEEKSADFAREILKTSSLPIEKNEKVWGYVMATKTHSSNGDTDLMIFLDADLSILTSNRNTYLEYTKQIRKEYSWVDDEAFIKGRREVLKRYLDKGEIFYHHDVRKKFEKIARENIQFEIKEVLK